MEITEEEEEYIAPNSPLFNYLVENGFHPEETCKSAKVEDVKVTQQHLTNNNLKDNCGPNSMETSLIHCFQSFKDLIYKYHETINTFDYLELWKLEYALQYSEHVVHVFRKAEIVDQEFIEKVMNETVIHTVKDNNKTLNNRQRGELKKNHAGFVLSIIVCIIMPVLFSIIYGGNISWMLHLLTGILIMLSIYMALKYSKDLSTIKSAPNAINDLLNLLNEETLLINKLITFIKEVESISLGMTQFHPNVPYSNLESSSLMLREKEQCSTIRKKLFLSCRGRFMNTRGLMKKFLLLIRTEDLEFQKGRLLADQSIDSLHELLTLYENETDHASFKNLKDIKELQQAQDNEFLHTILIFFLIGNDTKKKYNILLALPSILKDLSRLLVNNMYALEAEYKATQLNIFKPVLWNPPQMVNRKEFITEQIFHSTELHLKSALKSISQLKGIILTLEEQDEKDLRGNILCNSFQLIKSIHGDIQSSAICLEEMTATIITKEEKEKIGIDKNAKDDDNNELDIRGDNVIEHINNVTNENIDQMYEGIAEPSKRPSHISETLYDTEDMSAKQSGLLLHELKSILSVKQDDIGLVKLNWQELKKDVLENTQKETNQEDLYTDTSLLSKININQTEYVCEDNQDTVSDGSEDNMDEERKAIFLSGFSQAIAARSKDFLSGNCAEFGEDSNSSDETESVEHTISKCD